MREKMDLDLSHPFSHAISALHISHVWEIELKAAWCKSLCKREFAVLHFLCGRRRMRKELKVELSNVCRVAIEEDEVTFAW